MLSTVTEGLPLSSAENPGLLSAGLCEPSSGWCPGDPAGGDGDWNSGNGPGRPGDCSPGAFPWSWPGYCCGRVHWYCGASRARRCLLPGCCAADSLQGSASAGEGAVAFTSCGSTAQLTLSDEPGHLDEQRSSVKCTELRDAYMLVGLLL